MKTRILTSAAALILLALVGFGIRAAIAPPAPWPELPDATVMTESEWRSEACINRGGDETACVMDEMRRTMGVGE